MNNPILLRAALVVATLGAGSVLAQTVPSPSPAPTSVSPVVSDVGPRPAEDRSSVGAVVLENSMVRAQREHAFEQSARRTGVATIGRGVLRATRQKQTEADLAGLRLNEAIEFRGRGAASLDDR
ncbi:MAG TPA: hypothetical protein VGE20_17565 [Ramlibacter sp.]